MDDSLQQGSPHIGDRCYIGAGAKIIGDITVGENCRIGANAVVVQDIHDNATVVLQKPRVICHEEQRDNHFYCLNKNGNRVRYECGHWVLCPPSSVEKPN